MSYEWVTVLRDGDWTIDQEVHTDDCGKRWANDTHDGFQLHRGDELVAGYNYGHPPMNPPSDAPDSVHRAWMRQIIRLWVKNESDAIHETLSEWQVSDDDRFYAWLHDIEPTLEQIERTETQW